MTRTVAYKARRLATVQVPGRGARKCPHCGTVATMTRDHIIKAEFGAGTVIHGDVRNIRPMCQECNNLVDQCGQCIAAMACVRAVVGDVWAVSKAWQMSQVALTMRAA